MPQGQSHFEQLANLPFAHNRPTAETAQTLNNEDAQQRAPLQRATQTYLWAMPLINASGLANGQPFPSLGSRGEPAQNPDGSTDIYLGQKARAGKGYFAILRFYGPTQAAIDKSWVPTFFLSPSKPHKLIFGAGPLFVLPTATSKVRIRPRLPVRPGLRNTQAYFR